jgi:uncharacterized RDD family membrane protein YckC
MIHHSPTQTLAIRTPEGVEFSLLLAGPVTRFLAWLIDVSIISVTSSVVSSILSLLALFSFDFSIALSLVAYFIISIGYGIVLEWYLNGQTMGKRILRLRVMDVQGMRLSFSQVVIRNLLRFVDTLPIFYLVGGMTCLMSKHIQRLGDIAANTIVVRTSDTKVPDLAQIMSDKYNSFRDYPLLAARLRQNVCFDEVHIALQALLRRDELSPQARIDLFREMAVHFRTIVEFPEEAIYGLSEEQYIRNVVDIVYHR